MRTPGSGPERVVGRQRLGVGDVERRRARVRGAPASSRSSVTTTPPRATLTSSAPSLHPREERGVDQAGRLDGLRDDEHDDVGVGQQLGRARRSPCTTDAAVERRGACARPRVIVDLERLEPALDAPVPTCPAPTTRTPLVGQRVVARRGATPPSPGPGRSRRCGAGCASISADGELRGAGVVHPRGVAQRHALGQVGPDVVDAGRQRLHDAQPRHPRDEPRAARVRPCTAARRTSCGRARRRPGSAPPS